MRSKFPIKQINDLGLVIRLHDLLFRVMNNRINQLFGQMSCMRVNLAFVSQFYAAPLLQGLTLLLNFAQLFFLITLLYSLVLDILPHI